MKLLLQSLLFAELVEVFPFLSSLVIISTQLLALLSWVFHKFCPVMWCIAFFWKCMDSYSVSFINHASKKILCFYFVNLSKMIGSTIHIYCPLISFTFFFPFMIVISLYLDWRFINFVSFSAGVALNHLGHVGEENMPFYLNNGRIYSQQMGNSLMVVSSFWRKFEVEYAVKLVSDLFFSLSSDLLQIVSGLFCFSGYVIAAWEFILCILNAGCWSKY